MSFVQRQGEEESFLASSSATTPNSDLLILAERAAGAFGCDIRHLLRSSAAPPKVQQADVACCPGGRRSLRAIEKDIAKTRAALATALADVLLEVLWRSSPLTASPKSSGGQTTFPHTPKQPHKKAAVLSFDSQSGDDDAAPCVPLRRPTKRGNGAGPEIQLPQLGSPLMRMASNPPSFANNASIMLPLVSSALQGSGVCLARFPNVHEQQPQGKAGTKNQDDLFLSALVSPDDAGAFFAPVSGAALVLQKATTMATFLKSMNEASAAPSTMASGGGGDFAATHTASQTRAPDTNHWVLNGRYEFISRLGAGGQGAVWRVKDLTTGEFVAIKMVPRGKMSRHRMLNAAALRSSAGMGLLAGDLSADSSMEGSHAAAADDSLVSHPLQAEGHRHSSHPSTPSSATALDRSEATTVLDGNSLLAQSTDVLRLFYEGGATVGGELSESLAMEIVMGLFRHPNTVPLFEVIDDPSCNTVFLVMPLAKPLPFSLNTISGTLNAAGPSVDTILTYAKQAASVLSVFHASGIVHCDIKLDNFLLLPGPTAADSDVLVVADFGVCQLSVTDRAGHANLLGGGSGTLAYWAPECFAAKTQSDTFTAASDCYALGLCLYAMTFGRFPYWTSAVMNPLAWEKVIPGTVRYGGSASEVQIPVLQLSGKPAVLTEIIQGLLSPDSHKRMSAKTVLELAE